MPALGTAKICIFSNGDAACPQGSYVARELGYSGLQDARGCTACSCSPPSGASCLAAIVAFADAGCTQPLGSATAGGCISYPTALPTSYAQLSLAGATGGFCTPAGGTPTGETLPIAPTTFCCLQPAT
jgi:hypothetical protein